MSVPWVMWVLLPDMGHHCLNQWFAGDAANCSVVFPAVSGQYMLLYKVWLDMCGVWDHSCNGSSTHAGSMQFQVKFVFPVNHWIRWSEHFREIHHSTSEPLCPASSNAFVNIDIARRTGGWGRTSPLSNITAKHNWAPPPPCSVRAYSGSLHGFRNTSGSLFHGFASSTALVNVFSAEIWDAIGPIAEVMASWPSNTLAAPS